MEDSRNFDQLLVITDGIYNAPIFVLFCTDGYETWPFTLRGQHRIRMVDSRVLREYLHLRGMKTQEGGENSILTSTEM